MRERFSHSRGPSVPVGHTITVRSIAVDSVPFFARSPAFGTLRANQADYAGRKRLQSQVSNLGPSAEIGDFNSMPSDNAIEVEENR